MIFCEYCIFKLLASLERIATENGTGSSEYSHKSNKQSDGSTSVFGLFCFLRINSITFIHYNYASPSGLNGKCSFSHVRENHICIFAEIFANYTKNLTIAKIYAKLINLEPSSRLLQKAKPVKNM